MGDRRVVTTFAIDIRTQELLRLLEQDGYTTRRPNSDDKNYTIVHPSGDAMVIPHQGAGATAFGHILTGLDREFEWSTIDLYRVRLRAMFARNAERRNKKRQAMPGWSTERQAELTKRAFAMMNDCKMNLPLVMVDEEKAFEILLDHDLATKARGLEDQEGSGLEHMTEDQAFLRQRRLRNAKVEELAQAQLEGDWEITHQGLARAEDRYLLDGQHRVWAVSMSGIPCPMVLAENVPERGMHAMDATEKRNGVDALSMVGVPQPARAHTAIKLLHFLDNFPQDRTRWFSYTLSNPQLRAEVLNHYRDIAKAVEVGYRTSCSDDTDLLSTSLIAAYYVIQRACRDVWPEAPIDEFFEAIALDDVGPYFAAAYPQVVAKQCPVRQLNSWSRTWDTRAKSKKPGKYDKAIQGYCLIIDAWNDINTGGYWSRPQFQDRSATPMPYVRGGDE